MKTTAVAAIAVVAVLLGGLAAPDTVPAQETPRAGGVLKAAMVGEPPSLDLHWTTAVIVQQIMGHVYETLYTYDRNLQPIPFLAEGHTAADGGRRYAIALRKGVKFHNGKDMTSADGVASLTRWGRLASNGKVWWKNVEAIEAKDPQTVTIHLKEPSGSFLYFMAEYNNAAAIYPKEVIDATGDGPLKQYIVTGP